MIQIRDGLKNKRGGSYSWCRRAIHDHTFFHPFNFDKWGEKDVCCKYLSTTSYYLVPECRGDELWKFRGVGMILYMVGPKS